MGYLGGQQQLGTGPFSAAGGKGTLVGVLPLTLSPAPRTRVPCAYQPTRKNSKSPQAVILGVLASSGLVFAQLQTLGSASPFLALWTLGFYLVFLAF